MARAEAPSLRQSVNDLSADRFFWDRAASVRINDLARGTSLGGGLDGLTGRSVLIATSSQLSSALALIELDSVARRVTILPPDVNDEHLGALKAAAEVDAVVVDHGTAANAAFDAALRVVCTPDLAPLTQGSDARLSTEWVLLTSGTTGVPKMVVHTLSGLVTAIAAKPAGEPMVWGTFYDIRRYGGLQIFLRTVRGGGSLILSNAGEPVADHLARLGTHGVTHLSGTPSHWRRALMSPALRNISPRYVRLSGEIADQAVLDSLRTAFPRAALGHAYASTEAGVGFHVDDGLAGFPARYLEEVRNGVEMKIEDGSLRVRSPGAAARYVDGQVALADRDGFVDTGDMVEQRGDRYFFIGRKGGIINIGGLKVHPEEVEAVINRHPQVRMSLVRSRRNPITGSIVIADVVLQSARTRPEREMNQVKSDILALCRDTLARHKVPAAITFVPALDVAATGKLARRHG